jgi:hypothetical protein
MAKRKKGELGEREIATLLGIADPHTKEFRRLCNDAGFRVVFRSGLSRSETLRVLRSSETAKILASM